MRRHVPKPPTNGQAVPHAHPVNHCRALVQVDGAGLRKKLKREYEKALRDLDDSRRLLDQFQQTDQPQFTRWLNSHFGALLTELRELSQKIAADEQLIFQVESEVLFGGTSYGRAYQQVMEFRNQPEPPPRPEPEGGEPNGEPFGARPDTGGDGDEDELLDEFFEDVFGAPGPDARARYKREFGGGPRRGPAAPGHPPTRLKELYRALVRRLHPDSLREITAQKTEWWHQAQAAYEAGDADQLEVILTLCEIAESGSTAHTSASLLQHITRQLKSSLRKIKRQLTERRRDPAWNFSRRADREVLAAQMRHGLTADLHGMRERWRETQELIAGWKQAAERVKPPRRRKRQRREMDVPF
ncbi:MAG: hypothetical protein ABSH48_15705 [Verrucomicrobiota bacterium]|jgi:hypothetical protein